MTVNYFIKCPICGVITRMRTPAGYIYKQPVHIHCGKCNTLLTGDFICDNDNVKAYFIPVNCSTIDDTFDYEYEGQTSGELLSHKITFVEEKDRDKMPHTLSPAMEVMEKIKPESLSKYIGYAKKIENLKANWDRERIQFDLFFDGKYDLIIQNYATTALNKGYSLTDEYDVARYIHYSWFNYANGIFQPHVLNRYLREINYEFFHLNKEEVKKFCSYYFLEKSVFCIEKKLFKTYDDFLKISLNLLPAISTQYYNSAYVEDEKKGLSTCTFEDVKTFYLDSYELLADLSVVIKALDNIKYRGNYDVFPGVLNFEKLTKLSNASKVNALDKNEFFAHIFNLDDSANKLRNAIGHNDYEYNGLTQIIKYCPDKTRPNIIYEASLFSVAKACIEQMESAIILAFLFFELYRVTQEGDKILHMHPLFYSSTGSNNHCACGSGYKYKKCCRDYVEKNKRNFKSIDFI